MSYRLTTNDDVVVEVPRSVCEECGTLKNLFEFETDTPPFVNVSAEMLEALIAFTLKYSNKEKKENELQLNIHNFQAKKWENNFFEPYNKPEQLISFLWLGEYLNFPGFINAVANTIARRIRGKSPEEIREYLGLPDDLTEEEQKQIQAKMSWCKT